MIKIDRGVIILQFRGSKRENSEGERERLLATQIPKCVYLFSKMTVTTIHISHR